MDAKKARAATERVLTKKQQEIANVREAETKKQSEAEGKSRTSAYPSFMKDVLWKSVEAAVALGVKHAVVQTHDKIVAELATKKLVAEKYFAHMDDVHVDAENEYGSSGEGMHDAYTYYVIHINWGKQGECPACRENLDRRMNRW